MEPPGGGDRIVCSDLRGWGAAVACRPGGRDVQIGYHQQQTDIRPPRSRRADRSRRSRGASSAGRGSRGGDHSGMVGACRSSSRFRGSQMAGLTRLGHVRELVRPQDSLSPGCTGVVEASGEGRFRRIGCPGAVARGSGSVAELWVEEPRARGTIMGVIIGHAPRYSVGRRWSGCSLGCRPGATRSDWSRSGDPVHRQHYGGRLDARPQLIIDLDR
jgi:hypothetical protein